MQPATIYIDAMGHMATWQCPCGCGNISKVTIKECKVFYPHERFAVPEGVAGYEISDDGEFSATPVFMDPRCPTGLVYGIEHSHVIIHYKND